MGLTTQIREPTTAITAARPPRAPRLITHPGVEALTTLPASSCWGRGPSRQQARGQRRGLAPALNASPTSITAATSKQGSRSLRPRAGRAHAARGPDLKRPTSLCIDAGAPKPRSRSPGSCSCACSSCCATRSTTTSSAAAGVGYPPSRRRKEAAACIRRPIGMRSSVGVLGVIHGLSGPLIDWAAPPRRPPVVDDRTRHHAPRARMDGWWTLAARDSPCTPRSRRREQLAERRLTPTTVLMDGSPHPPAPAPPAGS